MEWVEVTGKSVVEAKDKALDYLGVDEAQAEFEVLEEPRLGLFRRVKGEARVRARIKPAVPRPKAERRDRRRGRSKDEGREGGEGDVGTGGEGRPARAGGGRSAEGGGRGGGAPRSGADRRPKRAERPDRAERPVRADRPAAAADEDASDARRERPPRRSTPDREPAVDAGTDAPAALQPDIDRPEVSGAEAGAATVSAAAIGAVSQPAAARQEPSTREEPLSEMSEEDRNEGQADDGRQTEHAVDFLTGLVASFGLDATVTSATVDENYDEVRITGADLGMLIGPKAGTLDSIQELTRVVAQRRSGGRGESRLRVDIAGYRQRRREALERFATKLAEEVRATGVIKALEPMNSADRKVVHDVVGTLEGVATLSEGEDPRRRVVIVPAS